MNQLGGSTKPATLDNLSIILSKVRTKPATLDNLSIILSKVRTKPATLDNISIILSKVRTKPEPIGPKFFVGHHVTTGKVFE